MVLDSGWILAGVATLTIIGAVIAWLMKLQFQLDSKLSYQRHEEICSASHAEKMAAIREVRDLIVKQESEAREDRHALRNEMHIMAIKVERIDARVDSIAAIQKEDRR